MIMINGKFATQQMTGVQRYATEMVLALDRICGDMDVELVVPEAAQVILPLKKIRIVHYGKHSGNLWEQWDLPRYISAKKGAGVHLGNVTPLIKPGVTCIYDLSVRANPQFFSRKFRLWYRLVEDRCLSKAPYIITISGFSKGQIQRYYPKYPASQIVIADCAWQHMERITADENALEKYGLRRETYLFALSSIAPNKNIRWIIKAAQNNPQMTFAIAGGINPKVFGRTEDYEIPENVKLLGYVSDAEAKALMRESRAFLFPTFYEGFGIPPLEAMSTGAQIIVSDTEVMHEVYEDAAHYIDPYNADVDLAAILAQPVASPERILAKYSWEKSAEKLLRLMEALQDPAANKQ